MAAQLDLSPCPSPIWLPGGHTQTIWGATVARFHHISFVRERVDTPDGDFLDFDCRFGVTKEAAESVHLSTLMSHLFCDESANEQVYGSYVIA